MSYGYDYDDYAYAFRGKPPPPACECVDRYGGADRTLNVNPDCPRHGDAARNVDKRLPHNTVVPVVGVKVMNVDLAALNLRVGEPLDLVREPDNPVDKNAIKVMTMPDYELRESIEKFLKIAETTGIVIDTVAEADRLAAITAREGQMVGYLAAEIALRLRGENLGGWACVIEDVLRYEGVEAGVRVRLIRGW